jgi:mono/diheme cytochrome c family protein
MKRVLFIALALSLTGCHSLRRGEPIVGALDTSDAKVAHGQELFMQHCYQCHSNGEGGMAPALNNKPAPRFLVKTQIRAGLGAMPSFKKEEISAEDLDQLVDYIMALRNQDSKRGK